MLVDLKGGGCGGFQTEAQKARLAFERCREMCSVKQRVCGKQKSPRLAFRASEGSWCQTGGCSSWWAIKPLRLAFENWRGDTRREMVVVAKKRPSIVEEYLYDSLSLFPMIPLLYYLSYSSLSYSCQCLFYFIFLFLHLLVHNHRFTQAYLMPYYLLL